MDSVTCTWVFDIEEYKTTQVLARRIYTPWVYLGFFACIPLLGFAGMFAPNAKANYGDSGFWTPIVVLVFVILYVISQQLPIRTFCGTWSFRRGENYNARITQTLSQEGYHSAQGDVSVHAKWAGLTRAIEALEGFALFRPGKKKSFLWLPKHGFSSPAEIDRCRALIQDHVKNFRRL